MINDPSFLALRKLCLALPQAEEAESHGRPVFRTRKIFAIHGATAKGAASGELVYPRSVLVLADPMEAPLLLRDHRFFVPAYYGPSGWVGLDFDAAPVQWDEVRELVEGSFRRTAPKRAVAELDARG